jgi:A/G-specific adenine glycosylase
MHKKESDKLISNLLQEWYEDHQRILPWRESKDPYAVWVSEVILQQTRVSQGYDYFLRFMEKFPDIKSLARAPEDEVLKAWQGLGYYSRARNLHAAARQVMEKFDGVFPSSHNDILLLKGVGEYTAAAVASIVFGLPYPVVDGNVYRVLSRLFAIEAPIDSTSGKRLFIETAKCIRFSR